MSEQNKAANSMARKPYEKPAYKCEGIFETLALACGKVSPTQAQCRFNRKLS
jgi:hypothetical protein